MSVFSQTSWQGWIVNDENLSDATQFSDCLDVNIYESSAYFKLSPEKTRTTLSGLDYRCSAIWRTSTGTTISYIAWGTWDWVDGIFAQETAPASYIQTTSKGVINATGIVGNKDGTWTGFIITNKWGLYTWSYNAASAYGAFTNAWLTNKKANWTYTTTYTPYVMQGNYLYYAYKNEVRCFDTTTWTEQLDAVGTWSLLVLDGSFDVTNLFNIGANITVWATDWTHTKKYSWWGVDSAVGEYIDYKNKRVDNVANFGNYEIALYKTLNQYCVWLVEWYDMNPLYASDYPYDTSKRGFQTFLTSSSWTIAIWDNIMWFCWVDPTGAYPYIYTLGNFKPWKPLALGKLSHDSQWEVRLVSWDGYINNIYSQYSAWASWKTWFSSTDFTSSGYIITNPIKWTSFAIRKTCKKIMYWYEMQTGSTIKVYYQINKNDTEQASANWTLLDTITYADFPWMWYRAKVIDWTFNHIRFKLQLETSDANYSPKLLDFHFEYDETSQEL